MKPAYYVIKMEPLASKPPVYFTFTWPKWTESQAGAHRFESEAVGRAVTATLRLYEGPFWDLTLEPIFPN